MDESQWNSAILEAGGDFMQSIEWGGFQGALGRKVLRADAGGLLSQAYVRPLRFGREEIYVPMGPVPYRQKVDGQEHLKIIKERASNRTVFIECDLLSPIEDFQPTSPHTRQPLVVSIVDIDGKKKDEIYNNFHSTLKENISRAERYKLEIRKEESVERFYEIYVQTMERHSLRPWHKQYMDTLWQTLRPYNMVEIWSCYMGSDLLASNLYVLFNRRATHLFGGTSSQKRETMAPHFLHSSMMFLYGERGFCEYDMGKIDVKNMPSLTRFKEWFGGSRKMYPGNFRLIVRPFWYKMYSLAKR